MSADAFTVLHRRHDAALRRRAGRLLHGSGIDVDDVMQEVWLRAYRALPEDANHSAWLHTVTANCCTDALRRGRPTAQAELDALPAGDPHAGREEARAVLEDLAALEERQRTAFVDHVLGGRPHAEIAAQLQVTPQASKSLVLRARRNLMRRRLARGPFALLPGFKLAGATLAVSSVALFTVQREEFVEPRTHPQIPRWELPAGFGIARHDLDVATEAVGRRLRVRLTCPDGYRLWQFDGLRGDARIVVPRRWIGRRAATITVIPSRGGKMSVWAHCRR